MKLREQLLQQLQTPSRGCHQSLEAAVLVSVGVKGIAATAYWQRHGEHNGRGECGYADSAGSSFGPASPASITIVTGQTTECDERKVQITSGPITDT